MSDPKDTRKNFLAKIFPVVPMANCANMMESMRSFILRKLIVLGTLFSIVFLLKHMALQAHADQASQAKLSLFSKFKLRFNFTLNREEIDALVKPQFKFSPSAQLSETLVEGNAWNIHHTINSHLQETMMNTLKKAKVPYGAFVAIDPATGKVVALVSHGSTSENFALRSTFPAASIFKIVTAAEAIDTGKLRHNSLIPFVGSYHTLFKRNIFKAGGLEPANPPRYARLISFSDAFAKSVNSVFAKVGIFGIGTKGIEEAAAKFAFNREIPFELPLQTSQVLIPTDDFGIAESASGFTDNNTMSPLHGALIAAAIANNGAMMAPSLIDQVYNSEGDLAYSFEPQMLQNSIRPQTAEELKIMLHRTITAGTSRGAFRNLNRSPALAGVYIGGKTGTLDGWSPKGRYDWFVGFAENGNTKLAIAALCIHGELRGMKASNVARVAFETYFKTLVARNDR